MHQKTYLPYKKIAILDHMGFGNLGDAAIQDVVLENIKKRLPDTEIIGFSYIPDDTTKRHKIETYPILAGIITSTESDNNDETDQPTTLKSKIKDYLISYPFLFNFAKFISGLISGLQHSVRSYKILKSVDLLIISGGGQLGDSYHSMPIRVFKFCLLAKLARKKLIILNVGAGPLDHFWTKKSAVWSTRLADYISVRDNESQLLLQNLGATSNIHVYPDTAYAYDIERFNTYRNSDIRNSLVGFNPSGFCDPRIWPRKDESVYQTYLDKITSFVFWLIREHYYVELFTSDIGVDKFVIEDLRSKLAPELPEEKLQKIFPPVSKTTDEIIRQISKFDYVITTKFHGIIFSHLLHKPVIALSWHNKNYDLMKAVGHEQYCSDIEHFVVESLQEDFLSLIKNTDDLKAKFKNKVDAYAQSLNSQFDYLFAGNPE